MSSSVRCLSEEQNDIDETRADGSGRRNQQAQPPVQRANMALCLGDQGYEIQDAKARGPMVNTNHARVLSYCFKSLTALLILWYRKLRTTN